MRANDGGWDFLTEGEVYQYKEGLAIAYVRILENNSDDEYYRFFVEVIPGPTKVLKVGDQFEISHLKRFSGVYGGMSHFYKNPEYKIIAQERG